MALPDMNKWASAFGRREYGLLRKQYRHRLPLLEKAKIAAMKHVAEIQLKHQGKATLRIAHVDGRVKSLPSLIKKACDRGVAAAQVFDGIADIVGLRIVVNNTRDITPLIRELRALPFFQSVSEDDQVRLGPYRAVHLKAVCTVEQDEEAHAVVMEIQVRTLLQDAWAVLTHHDIYKNQAMLPQLGQSVSEHLSSGLAASRQTRG